MVSQNLDYYKIMLHDIQQVDIGVNYLPDMDSYPNHVMDTIFSCELLFWDLPNEILYRDFYLQLLRCTQSHHK